MERVPGSFVEKDEQLLPNLDDSAMAERKKLADAAAADQKKKVKEGGANNAA